MLTRVPITEYAPAERMPLEVVQRQAQSLGGTPLTGKLLNSVLNYVFILNPQRQIVFASQNALSLTVERNYQSLVGQRPGEALGCIHAGKCPSGCGTSAFCAECGAVAAMLGALAGRKEVRECRMTRVINCVPEALDLLVFATPFEHEGETFAVFSIADISHEKRQRAFERIFFHDLINSAGGLEGLLENLESEVPDALRPEIELARAEFHHLLEQVCAQRDLIAAERAELAVSVSAVNSIEVLGQVVALYRSHEVAAGRRLELASVSDACVLATDRTLLKRVLGNLIKNALEASAPGEIVTTGCELAAERVRFWVHNPAVIPESTQHQLFNRSFSTKGSGRGLGTYSVKLLTERYLHGTVSFASSPEEGTTFSVSLPRA